MKLSVYFNFIDTILKLSFFQGLRENFKELGYGETLDMTLQIQLKSTDQSDSLSMKKVLKVEETIVWTSTRFLNKLLL